MLLRTKTQMIGFPDQDHLDLDQDLLLIKSIAMKLAMSEYFIIIYRFLM